MLAFLLFAPALGAQEVREISVATRLRKEPQGVTLVSLPAGTSVEPRRTRGAWREVVIEGWVFTRSTEETRRDGFDLVVTASGGENIRKSPNGAVLGRVRTGTLLSKEEVRGTWTRVRRAGWVPREAVKNPAPASPPAAPPPETPAPPTSIQPEPIGPVESGALPAQAAAAATPDEARSATERTQVARQTAIFAAPETGQYGTLMPGAPTRVLSRTGDWTRVQLEGWVRESDLQAGSNASLGRVTAAEVRADPPRYIGRTVDWSLELIAVQTADELRTEMPNGQTYLLTRGPLPEPGFVYVIVTESQANEFRALQALQELTLRVIIKAPRTRFLATPVVELVSRVME
ncbi:MAG: hypothetical protein M3Q75_14675 [Gemmatimonadota bacterium]|nr:hypothetical protein [Gemmatimonadota bacterium]